MKKVLATGAIALTLLALTAPMAFGQGITINPSVPDQFVNSAQIDINQVISFIIGLLVVIGILAALIYMIYGAIKWITSGGDKGAVESARGHIVAAVIGVVVLVLTLVILNFVLQIVGAIRPGQNIFTGLQIPSLACKQGEKPSKKPAPAPKCVPVSTVE
jgi:heme/copper-type cytochrome/quinol oxidase subunit 2